MMTHIAWALAQHFVLSASVGLLVYWSIWTTLSALSLAGMDDGRIRTYCWWLALSCAVAAHVLQDYLLGWF